MYNSLVLVSRRFSTSILRATVELKHSKVGGEAEFAVNSIKLENSSNPNHKRMKKLKKQDVLLILECCLFIICFCFQHFESRAYFIGSILYNCLKKFQIPEIFYLI